MDGVLQIEKFQVWTLGKKDNNRRFLSKQNEQFSNSASSHQKVLESVNINPRVLLISLYRANQDHNFFQFNFFTKFKWHIYCACFFNKNNDNFRITTRK